MSSKFVVITLGTWFVFMILAIVNAAIREGIWASFLDELRAHQLSTVTFMVFILLGTFVVLRYSTIELSDQQALMMGLIWFVLTLCFEFLAGHYLFGNSWDKLIADYNILNGRIWVFILITTFFAPFLVKRML